jgi:chemotaxis response regulator CheB
MLRDDGAQGLFECEALPARTIAQDELSFVIFGMPNKARRGATTEVLPLRDIATAELHTTTQKKNMPEIVLT